MNNTAEKLSAAIDQLNAGQPSVTTDQETAELLAVTALLRNSALPVKPPEHILSATVERAAAGLATHKKPSRNPWLYSGLLGAAAALLVFFGLHGTPEIQEIAQQTMPAAVPQATPTENTTPVAPTEKPRSGPPQAKPASPDATSAPPVAAPSAAPSVTPPAAKPAAPVQPVPTEARAERAATSLKSTIPPVMPKEKATAGDLTALKLPGRTADSITQDSTSGSIRQVFSAGTPQELVITQRKLPAGQKDAAVQSEQAATPEMARKYSIGPTTLKKVVITINDQEITLEGRQTVEELSALAKRLKP
jgi:hypothetical protein